ncbi:MAG: dienelactone hydrolase family protein [Ilumatobacteraceae bacterium]
MTCRQLALRSWSKTACAVAALAVLAAACGSDAKTAATTTVAPAASAPVPTSPASATSAPSTDVETTAAAVVDTVPADTGSPTTDLPTAPFETVTMSETFVDTSRPTVPLEGPQLASRTIETTIVYPHGPGPFPLIVMSHGIGGTPKDYTVLSGIWARLGYVVALPAFPLTNHQAANAETNLFDGVNQPKDVSFVIDQVLGLNGDDKSPLFGRIDADRIGVAGHSFGAATTYALTFADCCRDQRIKAVVILAGLIFIDPDHNDFSRPLPILIVHGDADKTLNIALDAAVYPQLAGPKWFVTLLGADHGSPYENDQSKWTTIVRASTSDFWSGTLGNDPSSLQSLRIDAVVDGLSTLESSA